MTSETEIGKGLEAKEGKGNVATLIGNALRFSLGLPTLVLILLVLLVFSAYLSWVKALPAIVTWANTNLWRWGIAWFGVMFAAFAPVWAAMAAWPVIAPALEAAGERREKEALGDLDRFEVMLRGSTEPVDYAIYGRKALNAYYLMGQNQARLSFYVGVAAMILGFLFLLAGLLVQVLNVTKLPWLRQTQGAEIVTVGRTNNRIHCSDISLDL
jgi:hypothetical protein